MNARLKTDWKKVAEALADVITELHPNYAPEVLAVISHFTTASNTTAAAPSARKEQAAA